MFIPELLPRAMRRRHRQTFFGDGHSKPLAVLTPIKAIFDELAAGEPVNSDGWWPCKVLDNALVALTPQGTPAVDALCSLEPGVQVIFVGLTGALRDLSLGDVVEPSVAVVGRRCYRRTSPSALSYGNVTVATVSSLNESLQRRKLLREQADCVDMETAWVFACARNHGRNVRAVLIVSDHLFHETYIETSLADLYPSIRRVAQEICPMRIVAESVAISNRDIHG
jgi:uridine phosphorylase